MFPFIKRWCCKHPLNEANGMNIELNMFKCLDCLAGWTSYTVNKMFAGLNGDTESGFTPLWPIVVIVVLLNQAIHVRQQNIFRLHEMWITIEDIFFASSYPFNPSCVQCPFGTRRPGILLSDICEHRIINKICCHRWAKIRSGASCL